MSVDLYDQDLYRRFSLNASALQEEVKRAYRDLARTAHPDKGGDALRMQELVEAYEILGDPVQRKKYDVYRAREKEAQLKLERQRAEQERRRAEEHERERKKQEEARKYYQYWEHQRELAEERQRKDDAEKLERWREEQERRAQSKARYQQNAFDFGSWNDIMRNMQGDNEDNNSHNKHYSMQQLYITKTGQCYHTNSNCWGLRSAYKKIPVTPYQTGGLRPCKLCAS